MAGGNIGDPRLIQKPGHPLALLEHHVPGVQKAVHIAGDRQLTLGSFFLSPGWSTVGGGTRFRGGPDLSELHPPNGSARLTNPVSA